MRCTMHNTMHDALKEQTRAEQNRVEQNRVEQCSPKRRVFDPNPPYIIQDIFCKF